jgi:hypothetical protein
VHDPPYDDLAEDVLSLAAELRAVNVASLRLGAVLDQSAAATAHAAEAMSAHDEADGRALTAAEMRRFCDGMHAVLQHQHALLEHGRLLRDDARARVARCALRLEAAQSRIDQLRTGDDHRP